MHDRAEVEQLVEDFAPLARKIAHRWGERYPWLDHCFHSACLVAVWDVAKKFGRHAHFAALAHLGCRWACIRRLDTERRRNREAFDRADTLVGTDGAIVAAVDVLTDDGAPADLVAAVKELLARLPPDRARQLVRHVIEGVTGVEIGNEKGTSAQAVTQMIRRDLAKLAALAV